MKLPLLGCGGLLLLWGLFMSCAGVGMVLAPAKGAARTDGIAPGIVLGLLPGALGLLLVSVGLFLAWQDRRAARELAWLRTRDRFRPDEFAAAFGRDPSSAEARIYALLDRPDAPALVYHRATREFLQRATLGAGARFVERCPACGSVQRALVLPGEAAACSHCAAGV